MSLKRSKPGKGTLGDFQACLKDFMLIDEKRWREEERRPTFRKNLVACERREGKLREPHRIHPQVLEAADPYPYLTTRDEFGLGM